MKQVETYLALLERRADFLKKRIKEREDQTKSHHDRHELYATNWAIRYIKDTITQAIEHQSKERVNGKVS